MTEFCGKKERDVNFLKNAEIKTILKNKRGKRGFF